MSKDTYQEITNQVIAAIEAGADKYVMPWNIPSGLSPSPVNVISKRPYRGINTMMLWLAASRRGYPTNQWATFNQWKSLGATVRKGEKSTSVVLWKPVGSVDRETGETYTRLFVKDFWVFNAAQVDDWKDAWTEPQPVINGKGRMEDVDFILIESNMATVKHGGARAFYRPSEDMIQMPSFGSFHSVERYYSVLSHELTHWTGAKHRLDRQFGQRFGDESYAMEELVAELGAAYAMAGLDMRMQARTDHAPYIDHWLKVLRADKRAIFTASSAAQKAADLLLGEESVEADSSDKEAA